MNWKAFFRGMGSILEIAPRSDDMFRNVVSHESVEEALAANWKAVGDHLRSAMGQVGPPPPSGERRKTNLKENA